MTNYKPESKERIPQIALVGTTRAGKSVFTTVFAKTLERVRDGIRLSPKGGKPKSTYAQIDEWYSLLQSGNWLPATPPGTLIELQWDLCIQDKKIPLKMFDYAGEALTDLFNGKREGSTGAAKEFFEKVSEVFDSASVLLVLINLESFIEKDVTSAGENKGTLVNAMTNFLEKNKQEGRSCQVCFLFTAYGQYESVILSKWGSVKEFLEQEIPPLYYEFLDEHSNIEVLPVAAINDTEARVDPHSGKTIRYPKPGFRTAGLNKLTKWLSEAVCKSKAELDAKAAEAGQDKKNSEFIEKIAKSWNEISSATELPPVDRFLQMARQNLPFPNRPRAAELQSQKKSYLDSARDLRTIIEGRLEAEKRESVAKVVKVSSFVIAGIVLVWLFFSYAGSAYEKKQETDKERIRAEQQDLVERLREPRPERKGEWVWQYTCNEGIFDCWEHRATATVPILNKGGPGNVVVTFQIGNESGSTTRFFNKDELSNVQITIPKMRSHSQTKGSIEFSASK